MYNLLSSSGVRISKIVLGTALFGVSPLEDEAGELIELALNSGVNCIDTANSYGNQSRFDRDDLPDWKSRRSAEEIVGGVIADRRRDVVLATKVSERIGDGPNDGGSGGGGLSRSHILRNVEHSLRDLQTSYIDIYYAHHPDPVTDIGETLRTFGDLISQGVIHYYGLSTYDGWQFTEAVHTAERLGLPKPICHQTRYSLAKRWVEAEVLPAARHAGVDIVAFSPLAGGLLASAGDIGKVSGDARWGGPQFTGQEYELREQFLGCAGDWHISPAQLALAWLLARPGIACAIVGPECTEELRELLPATTVELDAEQLDRLDEISPGPPSLWTQ